MKARGEGERGQGIDIGLKNGMSKDSVFVFRGCLNVFQDGGTLEKGPSTSNPPQNELFSTTWGPPSGLKLPKMKYMGQIWVYKIDQNGPWMGLRV